MVLSFGVILSVGGCRGFGSVSTVLGLVRMRIFVVEIVVVGYVLIFTKKFGFGFL